MNNSIGIWFDIRDDNKCSESNIESLDAELHINMWKLPHTNNYCRFIDFGIMIKDAHLLSALYFYFPTLDTESIKNVDESFMQYNCDDRAIRLLDLGGVISQPDILQAVFNEDYEIRSLPHSKYCDVSSVTKEEKFSIYNIDVNTDLYIKNRYGGIIFKLLLTDSKSNSYYRFRLEGDIVANLYKIERPANALLQSAFWNVEIIDFRVNEIRNLNRSLIETMKGQLNIVKYKFFYMCPSNEEILSLSHGDYKRCRYLENDIWAKYINISDNDIKLNKAITAYQWNLEGDTHVNMMIKSKYENNNIMTIFIYLLIVSIMSILFSIFGNFLYASFFLSSILRIL